MSGNLAIVPRLFGGRNTELDALCAYVARDTDIAKRGTGRPRCKGHGIAYLVSEEPKMPRDSQLPNQSFPSNRPVNGAFQWLALLGVALALITAIRLLW